MTVSIGFLQLGNDAKNALIAFSASAAALLETAGGKEIYREAAAFILPVLLFILGKFIDVAVQIYLARRRRQVAKEKEAGQ